jgi:hypothetical protein
MKVYAYKKRFCKLETSEFIRKNIFDDEFILFVKGHYNLSTEYRFFYFKDRVCHLEISINAKKIAGYRAMLFVRRDEEHILDKYAKTTLFLNPDNCYWEKSISSLFEGDSKSPLKEKYPKAFEFILFNPYILEGNNDAIQTITELFFNEE